MSRYMMASTCQAATNTCTRDIIHTSTTKCIC